MAKKSRLEQYVEKNGGKITSGGSSSSSSSSGAGTQKGSRLASYVESNGGVMDTPKKPSTLTQYYLDTLNNQTFLPHNTHMDELNAHMMEEGLHPIYTDNAAVKPFYGELTPYAKGKWTYDEKTDSFVPPKATDVDWYIGKAEEAKKKADAKYTELSGQRTETDPTDEIYKLTLDLNAGIISEEEYDRRVSEIGSTDYAAAADAAYLDAQKKAERYGRESAAAGMQIQSLLKAKDNQAYLQIVQNGDEDLFQGYYDAEQRRRSAILNGDDAGVSDAINDKNAFRRDILSRGYTEEEAEELINGFFSVINSNTRQEIEAAVRDFVEKHPVVGGITMTAANVLAAPIRGLSNLTGMMVSGGEKDSPLSALSYMSSATTEQVEKNINSIFIDPETGNGKGWAKIANFVYSAGTSAAESALTMALGGPTGGAILMGVNAGTETYQEALERGMSKGQALATGIAAGIAEEFFEKFSLESLSALKAQGRRGVLNFVKDFAKQSFTEGSEEFFTDIANELYDSMVNGEYSKFRQSVDRAMLSGKTWDEATKDYAYNFAKQLGESFIVGALSGGMGAGRVKAAGMIGNAVQSVNTGEGVRSAAEVQGISEQEVVRPVTELLGEKSKARRQIETRLSNEAPQGSQSSEGAADAAMESKTGDFGDNASASGEKAGVGTKSERKGSLFTRAVTYLQQTASDYRKGAAVTKAVYELKESDRVTIEARLKEAGYGDRNAKSTSYQILQLLSGEMESADAEHLLEKRGVEAVIGDYLTAQSTSETEEYKRTRAAAELLKSLDIARGKGSAEEKLRRIRWVSETYDLKPEEAIQYFADEATKDVTAEAKKLTRDGKDLSGVVKRAYKAQITVDGKALDVEIKGVAGVEDGDLLLRTENEGETVKLSEVDFDAFENNDDAKVVFETLRDVMTGDNVTLTSDAANVLLATWETQAYGDSEQFVKDWYRYYAAGKAGRSIRSVERSYDDVELQNRVSETVRESAYQFGAKEYKSEAGVKRVGTVQIGADTAEELYVLNEWAKDVGRSIVVVDALYEKSRRTGIRHAVLEGFSDREGIMLALKSEALFGEGTWREHPITVTAFHETVHQLRLTSEDVYQFLKEIALRALESRAGKEGMAKIYEQRETAYRNELSEDATDEEVRDLVEEEITAQYFGTAVTRGFIEEQVTKEHLSFWEKIRDTLKRIVDSLRKKLEELAKRDLVSAAVMEADVRELQAAVNLFNDAINAVRMLGPVRNSALKSAEQTGAKSAEVAADAANENKKSRMMDAGTIRYARMLDGNYEDIVDSVLTVADEDAIRYHKEGDVVQIAEHTPVELLELLDDIEDHPLIIRYDALYLETRRGGVYTGPKAHYHNLGPEIMKQIGRIIAQPYAILTQDTGYYNIIAPFPGRSDKGLISVDFGAVKDLKDKGNLKYNVVITAFDPKKAFYDIEKTKNKPDDKFHFTGIVYKKENLSQVNPQLHEWLDTINERLSKKNIAQNEEKVKREKDAEYMSAVEAGDKETAQRMVDEAAKAAGYTIRAYHGTQSEFTVFDRKKIGSNYSYSGDSSYGGFFFTNKERSARFYGNGKTPYHVLLRFQNPYVVQASDVFYDGADMWDFRSDDFTRMLYSYTDEDWGDKVESKNDGIIIHHSNGDLYVARDPSQIKLADPVTYDDAGNVIPLSERFNEKKDDIRYSIAFDIFGDSYIEVDRDLIKENNGKTHAQIIATVLHSEFGNIINANGQNIRVNQTTTKEWLWSDEARYLRKHTPDILDDKVRVIANADEILREAKAWINEEPIHRNFDSYGRGKIRYSVFGHDYAADVIVGIDDKGEATLYELANIDEIEIEKENRSSKLVEPAKEGSPVHGEPVNKSITQVNDESQERKSRELDAEDNERLEALELENAEQGVMLHILEAQYDALQGKFEEYKKIARQREGRLPTKTEAERIVSEFILHDPDDKLHRRDITDKVIRLLNDVYEGRGYHALVSGINKIMLEEVETAGNWEKSNDPKLAAFKKLSRGKTIYLTPEQLKSVEAHYGGKQALRRATFGRFYLTDNTEKEGAIAFDDFYDELMNLDAGFSGTTDPVERVMEMLRKWRDEDRFWVDEAKNNGWFGLRAEEVAADYTTQLLEKLLNATSLLNNLQMDFYDERLAELRDEIKTKRREGIDAAVAAVRAELKKEETRLLNNDSLTTTQIEERLNAAENKAIIEGLESAYQKRLTQQKSYQRLVLESREQQKTIAQSVRTLAKMLTERKKSSLIPGVMQDTVREIVELFACDDTVFPDEKRRYFLQRELSRMKKGESSPENVALLGRMNEEAKREFDAMLRELRSYGGLAALRMLTPGQTRIVANHVGNVLSIVKGANTAFVEHRRRFLDADGQAQIEYVRNDFNGMSAQAQKAQKSFLAQLILNDYLEPTYFFDRIGGPLREYFREMMRGESNVGLKLQSARDFLNAAIDSQEWEKWHEKKYTLELPCFRYFAGKSDEPGARISMENWAVDLDVEHMMTIYALSLREKNSGQQSHHLYPKVYKDGTMKGGGIVLSTEMQKQNAKLKVALENQKALRSDRKTRDKDRQRYREFLKTAHEDASAYADENRHCLTDAAIEKIIAALPKEAKTFVETVVDYMSHTVGDWGNAATQRLYGNSLFTEDFYFPYETPAQFTNRRYGLADDKRLGSWRASRNTQIEASTPIVISSFTDVAAAHIREMAMYSELLVPIQQMTELLNYSAIGTEDTSVRAMIETAYGKRAGAYLDDLMQAANGGVTSDAMDDLFQRGLSRFKKTQVLGNLSVVVQQHTAIFRALAVEGFDLKYFKTTGLRKADYEEMMKYSGVAVLKEIGGFDVSVGRGAAQYLIGHQKGFYNTLDTVLGWGAGKADALTWTHIWNAVKREIASKRKDLQSGSDEYFSAVRDRFEDIVRYTQVYDSVFTKNRFMRSRGGLARMNTAFGAEPTKTLNMLLMAGRGGTKGIIKSKKRAATAFLVNIVINSIASAIVGAWRHRDEDESFLESFLSEFLGDLVGHKEALFLDGAWSPTGMIPWVKEVVSALQGYDVKRTDFAVLTDVISSAKSLFSAFASENGADADDWIDFVTSLSSLFGIPSKKITQDLRGIANSFYQSVIKMEAKNTWETLRLAALEGLGFEVSEDKLAYLSVREPEKYAEVIKRLTQADPKKYAGYDDPEAQAKKAADQGYHEKIRKGLRAYDKRLLLAVDAIESGDLETYEKLRKEMIDDGFDVNDVQAAINTERSGRKEKTFKESSTEDKPAFGKQDLADAVMRGDKDGITYLLDWFCDHMEDYSPEDVQKLVDQGYSQEDAEAKARHTAVTSTHNTIKSVLVEYDERVQEAAEAKWLGDFAKYERIVGEINREGWPRNDVQNAVNSLYDALRPKTYNEPEESESALYRKKDLGDVLAKGSKKDFDVLVGKLLSLGETEDKIETYVRDWTKAAFVNDGDEAAAIRTLKTFADYDDAGAQMQVSFWDYDGNMNWSAFTSYYTKALPNGISLEVYDDYYDRTRGLSKKAEIAPIIEELYQKGVITNKQATALYTIKGWKR